MSTLSQVMGLKDKAPYYNSIRVKIVLAGKPVSYSNARGESRQFKTVALADETSSVKCMCYDITKFCKLVVGATIMLRNFIKRDNCIILMKTSRIYPTKTINVPESRCLAAEALVNPPEAPTVALKDAMASPLKTKISVKGKVVQDQEEREVMVRNTPTKIRDIFLQDESTEKVKISLWRDTCCEVRAGQYVKKLEPPTTNTMISVVGASVQQDCTELLLEDDSVYVVPSELLVSALPVGLSGTEAFFAEKEKTAIRILFKGTEISAIKLVL